VQGIALSARKTKVGRPALGRHGHTRVVSIKLSDVEFAAIAEAVRRENAEAARDGDTGKPATVSSWIRDHALEPLGLATYDGR
jgi:hypothetical protein